MTAQDYCALGLKGHVDEVAYKVPIHLNYLHSTGLDTWYGTKKKHWVLDQMPAYDEVLGITYTQCTTSTAPGQLSDTHQGGG